MKTIEPIKNDRKSLIRDFKIGDFNTLPQSATKKAQRGTKIVASGARGEAPELHVTWRTPLGPMTGRVSAQGVRALRFPPPEALTLKKNGAGVELVEIKGVDGGPVIDADTQARRHAEEVTQFLVQFFAGLKPTCPPLDMNGVSEFDRAVWEATCLIPPGETRSYGQIAATIGRPGAARAVGGALGRNRLVLLVPCHRVIAGAPGPRALCGFTGGLALKRTLLELEDVKM